MLGKKEETHFEHIYLSVNSIWKASDRHSGGYTVDIFQESTRLQWPLRALLNIAPAELFNLKSLLSFNVPSPALLEHYNYTSAVPAKQWLWRSSYHEAGGSPLWTPGLKMYRVFYAACRKHSTRVCLNTTEQSLPEEMLSFVPDHVLLTYSKQECQHLSYKDKPWIVGRKSKI